MKTRGKKALAFLLSLLMLISLFGGLTIVSAEGTAACFVQAVGLEADMGYLVVAKDGDSYYALTSSAKVFSATPATVDGNVATVTADNPDFLVWTFTSKDYLLNVGSGRYIYFDTGRVTAGGGKEMTYEGGHLCDGTYFLTFANGAFDISTSEAEAAEILLFTDPSSNVMGNKVDAFSADGKYYILARSTEGYSALGVSNKLFTASKAYVSDEGFIYSLADDTTLWTYSGGNLIHDASGRYFYLAADRVTAGGGQAVNYSGGHLGGGSFYVSFANGVFGASANSEEAAEILIFEQFTSAAKYTITFDPNASGLATQTGVKTEGEPYKITESLYREGYEFNGWNTQADGSGDSYAVGSEITADAELTLYAQWTQVESAAYAQTAELTEHYEYVVAAEYQGAYYALSYDGSIGVVPVSVAGNSVTTDSPALRWILSEDNELESVAKSGTFLYPYSSGMTYSSGRKLQYNADSKTLWFPTSSATGYVTFDGAKFGYSNNEEDAAAIFLFDREIEWVEPPQAQPAVYPEPDTVTRSAVKNADGSITLAFTSDTHHDGSETTNLQEWLEASGVGYIDAFGFCGDMASAYASNADDFWTWTQMVVDYMDGLETAGKVGNAIYTQGNHEWFPTAGGDYANQYQNYPAAQRMMQVGPGLVTEDYIIYCFGAGEIAATMKYDYNVYDVEEMAAYLETAPTGIPIFILTHFPIHEWYGRGEERYMKHADPVIDTLNAAVESGHQIIVLWGHNHSDFDDNYYAPVYPGDEIVINPKGDKRTLKFTYLSAGCTADAEYTGPSAGSAACMNKGLIVTINPDKTLTFTYYTMDGQPMHVESPWMVSFRKGVDNYEVFTRQYVADGQTAKKLRNPRASGYEFEGWFTYEKGQEIPFSFDDPITRNLLVTAHFRELPVEDLTITPESSVDDEPFTMTATGLLPRYTNFDIGSLLGSGEGPYTYALWFEKDGTFSFNREMTLTHQYFDSDFNSLGTDTVVVQAGEVVNISDGVFSEVNQEQVVWSEFAVSLDDGNSLMIIDSEEPGNYSSSQPNTHLSDFPGIVTGLPEIYYEYIFALNEDDEEPQVFTKLEGDVFEFSAVESPFMEGYDFIGWNTEPDGSGEMYVFTDSLDADEDLVFYAILEESAEEENTGSGDGTDSGSTSGGSTEGTDKPDETEAEPEEELEPAVVAVEATVEDGVATAVAEDEAVVEAAKDEEKGDVVLQVEAKEEADSTAVEVSAEAAKAVADADKALIVSVGGDEENAPEATVEISSKDLGALAEQGEAIAVQIQNNEDGSVTIDVTAGEEPVELEEGIKISLSAELEPGQVLVVVAEDGTETVVRKSASEDGVLTALLEGGATVKIVDNAKEFDDVAEDAWYADAVDFVSSHELFVGDENGNFNPTETMTRAMMAMVMFRLEGEPEAGEGKSFADVEAGKWYSEAINWASAEGVMNGYGESFGVNDPVTREQMAVMLYNYVQSQGIEVKKGSASGFSDAGEIHSWAADAMAWAVEEGIFQGDGQGKLNPTGEATRADVATLMQRIVKLLLK